jgi:hypothetical protein
MLELLVVETLRALSLFFTNTDGVAMTFSRPRLILPKTFALERLLDRVRNFAADFVGLFADFTLTATLT